MCHLPKTTVGPCGQKMGPLPEERVTPSPQFSDIGIDFAGPLYVKERTIVKKTYVCLFTCASSRMVHMELTNSLTTDEFLQAFSRMTSRRGLCRTTQKHSKPQVMKFRSCIPNARHKASPCGTHWIKIASSQS